MNSPETDRSVHLLLVEDNPGDVRLIREAFKEGRIRNELHVATNGEEALDYLYQRGDFERAVRPDLVLLDLNLPRIDGVEVLKEIKGHPDLKSIPVIILTSSKAEEDIAKSYEYQSNAYLTKPVSPDEFIRLVRTLEAFWLELVTLPPTTEE